MKNKNVFFFLDLSEGMENCKKSGKNQGKVGEFRGGLQVTTLVILMIEILGYLCLFYCINRPFSHCFCACVYRSRDALFLDNRRDFTKMGQTDFEPLTLSM